MHKKNKIGGGGGYKNINLAKSNVCVGGGGGGGTKILTWQSLMWKKSNKNLRCSFNISIIMIVVGLTVLW